MVWRACECGEVWDKKMNFSKWQRNKKEKWRGNLNGFPNFPKEQSHSSLPIIYVHMFFLSRSLVKAWAWPPPFSFRQICPSWFFHSFAKMATEQSDLSKKDFAISHRYHSGLANHSWHPFLWICINYFRICLVIQAENPNQNERNVSFM